LRQLSAFGLERTKDGGRAAKGPPDAIFCVNQNDLLAVADRFGIGTAPQVLKQVGEAVSAWPDFATRAGVGPSEIRRFLGHHQVL